MKNGNSQIRDVPGKEIEISGSWYLFSFPMDSLDCYLKFKLSSCYEIVVTYSPECEVAMNNEIEVLVGMERMILTLIDCSQQPILYLAYTNTNK